MRPAILHGLLIILIGTNFPVSPILAQTIVSQSRYENWTVLCRRDAMTDVVFCYIATPLLDNQNKQQGGVTLSAGMNDYWLLHIHAPTNSTPQQMTYRIDGRSAVTLKRCNGNRCVNPLEGQSNTLQALISGKRILVRRDDDSSTDTAGSLLGFNSAFTALQEEEKRWHPKKPR